MTTMRQSLLCSAIAAALMLAAPGVAQEPLERRVETIFAEAGPGPRFGMVVTTEDGREIVAIAADDRFIPASNTKMFPTAAAFASIAGLDRPDASGGASVRLENDAGGAPDVILSGHGDARLSSAADCSVNCLAALADAVAAHARRVDDIVGDDSLFPDQRWSPGMSWNNIPHWYGTGISALTLDDNEIPMRVTAAAPGMPPQLELLPYFEVENRAVTVAVGETDLGFDRLPTERRIRLTGTIAAKDPPEVLRLGIDDPAHYAAWRMKALLEARGVEVGGDVRTHHRPVAPSDDPETRGANPPPPTPRPEALARLTPPPLAEDLTIVNKVSQNLHAELILRRVGLIEGTGSIEDGQEAIEAMLARAGVARSGFDFSDGSGMSTYNRLSPRAATTFLRWVAVQPWGAAWRATLPVAGIDGTLSNRFKDTGLEGRLFAKTGSINATYALSGYFIAKSGRTFTFSVFANDVPADVKAREAMDAALLLVANEN